MTPRAGGGEIRRRVGALTAAVLLSGSSSLSPAWAAPPLWRIISGRASVTLFGSVHLLAGAPIWMTPALKSALAGADAVWMEIPFDAASQKSAADAAERRGSLSPSQSLFAMLPKADRARLERIGRREGLTHDALDRLQPWFAETLLSVLSFEAEGASPTQGVEDAIASQTPRQAQRGAFETVEGQIDLFADVPRRAQIASLRQTLRDLDRDNGGFRRLQEAWLAGNVVAVDQEAVKPLRLGSPEVYRRLVRDRNARWVRQIVKLLHGRGRSLVIVGIGHLVGPDSVVRMLRARGYRVEGP